MADHQPEAPLVLSNAARQYVASATSHAIFFVRVREVNEVHPDRVARLALARLLRHGRSSQSSDSSEPLDDTWYPGEERTATGFAVRRYEGTMLILTAAHIIRPVYAHRTVVTNECTDLNTAFRFEVMCIHQERSLVSAAAINQDIGAMTRRLTYARVLAIDSQLDLLALQVFDAGILNYTIQEDNKYLCLPCGHPHGLIPIAEMPAIDGEEVLLQAWPELRSDSTFWAITSYPERRLCCLTSSNPYRYGMRLLELPGVRCPKGCSGGPVVNAHLQAVGVLHGTLHSYGYAVSSSNVLDFLQRYHLLEGPIPPPPLPL